MDMNTLLAIGIFLLGLGFVGLAWSLLSQTSRKEKALARIDEYTELRRKVQSSANMRNQVPTSVLQGTRRMLLDTLGCIVSARATEAERPAAADPPELPPGTHSTFHGLRAAP